MKCASTTHSTKETPEPETPIFGLDCVDATHDNPARKIRLLRAPPRRALRCGLPPLHDLPDSTQPLAVRYEATVTIAVMNEWL